MYKSYHTSINSIQSKGINEQDLNQLTDFFCRQLKKIHPLHIREARMELKDFELPLAKHLRGYTLTLTCQRFEKEDIPVWTARFTHQQQWAELVGTCERD